MCGIAGAIFKDFNHLEEKKKLVTNLLKGLEIRGTDASGIATINSEEDSINVFKAPIKSSELVKTKGYNNFIKLQIPKANVVLLHARAATTGSKEDNKNNHPIHRKELNSVLIHNGVITNNLTIREKLNLKTDGEVDSEIILDIFEKYKNMNKLYTLLDGSYTFALYQNKTLHFIKHRNPLIFAYIKELDCIIFASTQSIIDDAITEYIGIEDWFFLEKRKMYELIYSEPQDNLHISFSFTGLKYTYLIKELEFNRDFDKKTKKKFKGKFNKDDTPKNVSYYFGDNFKGKAKDLGGYTRIGKETNLLPSDKYDPYEEWGYENEQYLPPQEESFEDDKTEDEGELERIERECIEAFREKYATKEEARGSFCPNCGFPVDYCTCDKERFYRGEGGD
jgi:predicted glutamine amidotransferase